jgi:Putative Flp pilus-assembly TadE/G-like
MPGILTFFQKWLSDLSRLSSAVSAAGRKRAVPSNFSEYAAVPTTCSASLSSKIHQGERGVLAIVTALCFVVLIGFVGLGIDVGMWYRTQRASQNAADAAALAAAINAGTTYASEAKAVAANTDLSTEPAMSPSRRRTIRPAQTVQPAATRSLSRKARRRYSLPRYLGSLGRQSQRAPWRMAAIILIACWRSAPAARPTG